MFFFCFGIVIVQFYIGSDKFVSHPRGTSSYTTAIELPIITICHQYNSLSYDLKRFNISYYDYTSFGKFSVGNFSPEEVYEESTESFYHFLDSTGKKFILLREGLKTNKS